MKNGLTLSYCGAEVRQHDPDRFATAMFAPPQAREDLFALFAFNHEIAKVRELVSEPMMGEIRLQWWREAIAGIFDGTPRRHGVVEPLAAAVRGHGLSRRHFDRLVDSRAFDLRDEPPDTLAALEDYAEGTSSTLVWLALEVLESRGEAALAAGRHVGIAWALIGLLRALPFHLRARRNYMPREITDRFGVALNDLMELRSGEPLRRAVAEIAGRAEDHLSAARRHRKSVPRQAAPALLPARLADSHLARLRRCGFDPLDPRVPAPRPFPGWRLAAAAFAGRY